MGRYFGTDGFRGEANKELTAFHAFKIGRFLGYYYKNLNSEAKIVIGKDTRRSSYMFEYSLAAGITASGADCYLLHVTTTPSVAYITRTDKFDCGIMISASHNPFTDNGIKLFNSDGEKMNDEIIDLVEDYIDDKMEVPYAYKENIGATVDYASGRNRYIAYLISLGKFSFKGWKVGLDAANGAAWNIAKSVFNALGATTYTINDTPNGINCNLNAGSTHIEGLQQLVKEKGLDCGFAFDGDADRCLAVSEDGEVITGDHTVFIYAKYLKDRGLLETNTVVATVMSNYGFFKALEKEGIEYAQTKVGDKYVHDYMLEHGNLIGGEQSGHTIFSKYATTGDGVLTALMMMEVMIESKKKLAELAKPCKFFPQQLINVRVTSKKDVANDKDVQDMKNKVSELLNGTGRIILRESGTEPVVRVMVEASTDEECDKYANMVVDVIKEKGYAV